MVFSTNRLYVQYRPDIQHTTAYDLRKYTLTHSDITGDLFLTVSTEYAFDQVNDMRDEVLGEWIPTLQGILFRGEALVGDETIPLTQQKIRYEIFNREMSTALQGIFYGERWLLEMNPALLASPVYILFVSNHPEYSGFRYFGKVNDYLQDIR
ncbi:staygreen family protein [Pontibacillus marinus]|uniref:Staygreen protein domain-containing protein n=1 Tax=Pontibacillus marinus BH030004 = DSM 16465 TaxID=1385511 RepID=A0A0A5G1E5_9BACI|nr:staygreen family protein [Pontibacillus marinus]KGX84923.1 hypothetical protein N783_15555 [Pontibacillus marinus BH030004 = DSM 16465]